MQSNKIIELVIIFFILICIIVAIIYLYNKNNENRNGVVNLIQIYKNLETKCNQYDIMKNQLGELATSQKEIYDITSFHKQQIAALINVNHENSNVLQEIHEKMETAGHKCDRKIKKIRFVSTNNKGKRNKKKGNKKKLNVISDSDSDDKSKSSEDSDSEDLAQYIKSKKRK